MKIPVLFLAGLLALSPLPTARAKFAMPAPTPVDRLIKNTEAKLAKDPDNLELRYHLARVHYLAFALKKTSLGTFGPNGPQADLTAEHVASKMFLNWGDKKAPALGAEAALAHASRGAELFLQVLQKNPKHTLANLGLGSLLEQFATESVKNPPNEMPAALAKHDGTTIRKYYETAFEQAWREDKKAKSKDVDGLNSFVSYEAAQSYLRTAKADAATLTGEEKENVRWMEGSLKQLDALPMGPITPLVFSLRPATTIAPLLAPEVSARFDLRGFGGTERWPWLQGDTAILVWDPAHTGRITSARQMFGSYTWQLFWSDGFAALAALDDNQDDWISGTELAGLSVWQDRNQNAVSDPGEVMPVEEWGIAALACTAPEAEDIHPLHRQGVKLRDGSTLPMWDWTVSPLKAEPMRVAAGK